MVTKGLDLPEITLVGVLLADSTLHLPDFRSAERTFQFLTQVAGRSGRGDKAGEVIVQTFSPDHYSIRYASMHDFEGFYEAESSYRKALGYPPFKRLIRVLIKGNNKEVVQSSSLRFRDILDENKKAGIDILGPVPAPFQKIRGKYRWHTIIKGSEAKTLNSVIKKSLTVFSVDNAHKGVQIEIDVDPLSLL
jgi:primosomal protein N' (replication factor Y)